MKVTSSIIINQPIEVVFGLVSRMGLNHGPAPQEEEGMFTLYFFGLPLIHLKTHTASVTEIRQVSKGPLGRGTTFLQLRTSRGVSSEDTIEVTEYEPPSAIAYKICIQHAPQGESEFRFVLAPVDGGTRLTESMTLKGGCHRLLGPFMARELGQQIATNLRKMKEVLEASPDAQDTPLAGLDG